MHHCAKWRKIFVLRKIKKNIPSSSLSAFRDRNLIWERAEKNDDHIEKKNKPLTHFAKWIEIIFGWALVEVSCFYEHNSPHIMSRILKNFGEHLLFWSYAWQKVASTIPQYEFVIKNQLTATFFRSLNLNVSRNLGQLTLAIPFFKLLLLDKILMNYPDDTEGLHHKWIRPLELYHFLFFWLQLEQTASENTDCYKGPSI